MSTATKLDPSLWLDRHGDALYAYALARVRSTAVAEDLVQETLLAAWTGRESYRGESAERTWLTGILKHKVLDYLRRLGREVPLEEERDYPPDMEDTCFDTRGHWQVEVRDWARPDRVLENERLLAVLGDCIAALPGRLAAVFVMREVDGMETAELVESLGISSPGNLWVMLSRARLRLRACLEERAHGPGG